jgi:hypothetical protein
MTLQLTNYQLPFDPTQPRHPPRRARRVIFCAPIFFPSHIERNRHKKISPATTRLTAAKTRLHNFKAKGR